MVEKREVGVLAWARVISSRNTQHTVINLRPDTQYQFRVTAFNAYGASEACEATAVVCTKREYPSESFEIHHGRIQNFQIGATKDYVRAVHITSAKSLTTGKLLGFRCFLMLSEPYFEAF